MTQIRIIRDEEKDSPYRFATDVWNSYDRICHDPLCLFHRKIQQDHVFPTAVG